MAAGQVGLSRHAKVMHIEEGQDACYVQMSNELQSLCRSEHKNLLSIKKVHAGRSPTSGFPGRASAGGTGIVLCIAFEQCSTSIYQLVVDGYRGYSIDGKVRSVARRMNPHDGTLTPTAVAKIGDLLSAIQRLHFIGVAHLRICPTNILVDSEACFKLADFLGKYKLMYFLDREPRRDYAALFLQDAVIAWCAPELVGVLRACERAPLNAKKADIWAMGACIFFAMTGQHPFGTFNDEEKYAAAGALGFTASSEQMFVGGVESVVGSMLEGNIVNQHLLYDLPLVMDLLFRMLGRDPATRMDASDLTRHPIFWDFSQICAFISGLPLATEKGQIFRAFSDYSLAWDFFLNPEERSFVGNQPAAQTVLGLLQALQGLLGNSPGGDRQAGPIVLRILQRHPLALIRAWDASRLEASTLGLDRFQTHYAEAFSRPHLGWMEGKNAAALTHEFVREYYAILAAAVAGSTSHPPLLAAEKQTATVFGSSAPVQWSVASSPVLKPQLSIRASGNVWQPPVQTPKAPSLAAPTKEAVRQMAAASAALSTIHENPSVVAIIAGCHGEPTYSDKLTAAAAIYTNLLASSFTFGGNSSESVFDARQLMAVPPVSSHHQSTVSTADDESLFLHQEQLAEQIAANLTLDIENAFSAANTHKTIV
jgi:serine/threonine protein kinase